MFEELRQQASDSTFPEEEQDAYSFKDKVAPPQGKFLGMTPVQRFILAFMLLVMVCILSAFCLLVTEKVVPPFL